MLQKIENSYLAILRFVVILVAGLVLISVVFIGINALKLFKHEPVAERATPVVNTQDIISRVTRKEPSPAAASEPVAQTSADTKKQASALDHYYQQAASAIVKFGSKMSHGQANAQQDKIVNVLKEQVAEIKEPGHEEEYAKGLASTFEKALASPEVMKATNPDDPFQMVDNILSGYTNDFNADIEKATTKHAQELQKFQEDKADGLQSLYYAIGAFCTFLMIVFLSITIRIERNLRNLEHIPELLKSKNGN